MAKLPKRGERSMTAAAPPPVAPPSCREDDPPHAARVIKGFRAVLEHASTHSCPKLAKHELWERTRSDETLFRGPVAAKSERQRSPEASHRTRLGNHPSAHPRMLDI